MDMCCDAGDPGFRVVRGDDWPLRFDVDAGGQPASPEVWENLAVARFTMASDRDGMAVAIRVDISDAADLEQGCLWILVPHSSTDVAAGVFRADLELEDLEGRRFTPWIGTVTVIDDVTKHDQEVVV